MTRITSVALRQVLDSRGDATVEADVLTESGGFGRAAAPSGASTGAHEAVELPPQEAIAAARERAVPRIEGTNAADQRAVDRALQAADGTDDFSEIGANAAVAISMGAAKAGADAVGAPTFVHLGGAFRGDQFPVPLGNVIGGGEHASDATHIQEFLAAPIGAPSVSEAVFTNAAVHETVADLLAARDIPAAKGDEGAWAPDVTDAEAFELMSEAIDSVSEEVGFEVRIGVDIAATELYDADTGVYRYGDRERSPTEQREYVADLVDEYDLAYVEDPLEEDDFQGFTALTQTVGDRTLVCGDDLFVTNVDRLEAGIAEQAANSLLVKPNQIGTLSQAVDAVELAHRNGFESVLSHRSGETEDATIAHLAVATGARFIKTGTVGGERTAKLNELIRIADNAV